MEQQSTKRGPGRPATGKGRKPRLDITVSQEVADFLRDYGAQGQNISAFVERLITSSLEWKYR